MLTPIIVRFAFESQVKLSTDVFILTSLQGTEDKYAIEVR